MDEIPRRRCVVFRRLCIFRVRVQRIQVDFRKILRVLLQSAMVFLSSVLWDQILMLVVAMKARLPCLVVVVVYVFAEW